MNILIVKGSPRGARGGSSLCADALARGIKKAGGNVKQVILKDYNIKHCTGCFGCWSATPGKCVLKDDMEELMEMQKDADLMVLSTPVYVFTVPGLVKDFLDRRFPILDWNLKMAQAHAYQDLRVKMPDCFFISTAALPDMYQFEVLDALYERLAPVRKIGGKGRVYIPGAERMMFKEKLPEFTPLFELLEKAGEEIIRLKGVSAETEKAIDQFVTYTQEQKEQLRQEHNEFWGVIMKEQKRKKAAGIKQ